MKYFAGIACLLESMDYAWKTFQSPTKDPPTTTTVRQRAELRGKLSSVHYAVFALKWRANVSFLAASSRLENEHELDNLSPKRRFIAADAFKCAIVQVIESLK